MISIARLSLAVLLGTLVAFTAAQSALAACSGSQCAILPDSSLRIQFGNGLPFPIAAVALPAPTGMVTNANGAVKPVAGAVLTAGSTAPRSLMIDAAQLTWPGITLNIGLHLFRPSLYSVQTKIPMTFPRAAATLAASGRSGAATATYCPGAPFPGGTLGTPGCLGPNTTASGGPTDWAGLMRYTRTAAQFGGVAVTDTGVSPTALVAINVGDEPAPCTMCVIGLQLEEVNADGFPTGQSWAHSGTRPSVPNTPGFVIGSVNASGLVTNVVGPTPSSIPFPGNTAMSVGGPWTTGQVFVTAPGQIPPEKFTLTGSDQRTPSGEGTISLVAGGIAFRTNSNQGGNRGWLTLSLPEPGLATGLLAGAGLLAVLARRRR